MKKTSTTAESEATSEGMVVRTQSGFHTVLVGDQTVVCRAPKRLLLGERRTTSAVVIGDRVRVGLSPGRPGTIIEILNRDNELMRGGARGSHYLDVIATNLDLLVAVHSLRSPEFNPARMDRFLLIAEAAEIPALVCLNKMDLAPVNEVTSVMELYIGAGYPVISASVPDHRGIDELRSTLNGKISAFIGPSGAGKSTLLNAIQPGLKLKTGAISASTGKGRHTTVTAELLALEGGGFVADTPGLRELAIREVTPEELEWLFPEFRPVLGQCRFTNCSHGGEIECAVRDAVEAGTIARSRYDSYLKVYGHLKEQLPW